MQAQDEIMRRLVSAMRSQLGQAVCDRLDDPDVVEVLRNSDGRLWEDRLGSGMAPFGAMSDSAAESVIANAASMLRGAATRESPIVECELPIRGARFEGMIPPTVSSPIFAIRLRASRVFLLAEYVEAGMMTRPQQAAIGDAVASRRNILICGGTGSGKTTLVNAILAEIAAITPGDRLVILEDTAELQCEAPNVVSLRATDTVDLTRLLRATMRLRPDRIVVGEVRGGEALGMLKAWNTGHPGGTCTIHANSARAALTRLEQLVAEVTAADMRPVIAEAIDLIVPIARTATGREVLPLLRVEGWHRGEYVLTTLES